jgi:hypothetical protein
MQQTQFGIGEAMISRIQFRKLFCGGSFFRFTGRMNLVGMQAPGQGVKFLLERIYVQPWAAGFVQKREVIRHGFSF